VFDLEREVAAWSEAVHASRCRNAASVAELSDHLHCEIDRARSEGMSDEMAFAAAVAKLGEKHELSAEHAKNRSILGKIYAADARYARSISSGQHRGLLIAHAMIWAVLILASSLVMSKTDARETFVLLITCVWGPLWWGSDQILRRALHQGPGRGRK